MLRVSGCGLRVTGCGFRVTGCGSRVAGFGFRVSGYGLRVTGFQAMDDYHGMVNDCDFLLSLTIGLIQIISDGDLPPVREAMLCSYVEAAPPGSGRKGWARSDEF
jgi:hypothetical protein